MPDGGDAPDPSRSAASGRSVRQTLAAFTLALTLPVLVFAGIVLWQFAVQERARLEGDAAGTARVVALAIDRDLTGLFASLDVLSTSAYLAGDDIEGFYRQAAEIARRQDIVPILTDPAGQQLANLRVPWGTPLPRTNQPWDAAALSAGKPFVTDLFSGQLSGRPLYSVIMPVMRAGQPAYVLSFSLEMDRLRRILAEADIPAGYIVSIIDRAGRVMARSLRHEQFVGVTATDEFLRVATGPEGTWTGVHLEGGGIFGAYSRSRLSGFRAAVGVTFSDLNAPLWRSLSLFAGLFAIVTILSLGLGLLFGSRITRPIRELALSAAQLGRGETVPALATSLHEANLVGGELAAASASLRARQTELVEANEEIQRFAYIVSHDLRSPLVNIMGFTTELETLRDDLFRRLETLRPADAHSAERAGDARLGAEFDEAVGFIKTSIDKMDRLINAILRLSREGRREFTPEGIDMNALAAAIVGGVAHQADTLGATVTAGPLPAIRSDRVALEQIFTNLVDNALKYGRAGTPGDVRVTGRTERDRLVYIVADNGRGIDPRDTERVFELFRRSGVQDRPGEGIGLAHVRALVRRLGGGITLTSALGQGSTFTVVLPRRWTGEARGKAG